MALVKFGAGVSEMRGKEGGVIYSKNAYGNYIKAKVTPTNPQTSYQQAVRADLQGIAQSWAGLTESQKNAWNALGDTVTRTNVFGDQTTYKGFGLFMRLNLNLKAIGQDPISEAPTVPELDGLSITSVTATRSTDALDIVFTPSQATKGTSIITYATYGLTEGKAFVKNLRRQIQVDSEPTGTIDAVDSWKARFGAVVVGTVIHVALKLVDETTGFDGSLVVGSDVVEAGA